MLTYKDCIDAGFSSTAEMMRRDPLYSAEAGMPQKPHLKTFMWQRIKLAQDLRRSQREPGADLRALAEAIHFAEGQAAAAYYWGDDFFVHNPNPEIHWTRFMLVAVLPKLPENLVA